MEFPRGVAEAISKMAGGPLKLMALQRKFSETVVVGTGGAGGLVKVHFTLLGICKSVHVDASLLHPAKQKELEEATRDAVQGAMVLRAQEAAQHLSGSGGAAAPDAPQLK